MVVECTHWKADFFFQLGTVTCLQIESVVRVMKNQATELGTLYQVLFEMYLFQLNKLVFHSSILAATAIAFSLHVFKQSTKVLKHCTAAWYCCS